MKTFKPKFNGNISALTTLSRPETTQDMLNNLERVHSEQLVLEMEMDRLLKVQSELLSRQDKVFKNYLNEKKG